MPKKNGGKALRLVRWIARVYSGLAAALILLLFVGQGLSEGFEPWVRLSSRETVLMVAFAVVWLGLVLGWKWELFGGLLTVFGALAFYLLGNLFSGSLPKGPFFIILAAPSLLFLYCGLQARRKPGAVNA